MKNRTEKKLIKPIKILKKLAGSIRFYKQKTKKTEPNQNRKKQKKNRAKPETPSQNRAKPEKTEPKPEKTKPN